MSQDKKQRPGLPILARYARGEKDTMKYWSKFIENDPQSREAVDILQKLDQMFESMEVSRMAPDSKQLASEIFTRFQADRNKPDKNIAHLYYDSKIIPLREGFRPSLMSERRLKYAGRAGTIELSVVPVFPGRFEVTGRLVGDGADSETAVRLKGRKSLRTRTDDFGFFTFGAVNPGSYRLHFDIGKKEMVIQDLTLR